MPQQPPPESVPPITPEPGQPGPQSTPAPVQRDPLPQQPPYRLPGESHAPQQVRSAGTPPP